MPFEFNDLVKQEHARLLAYLHVLLGDSGLAEDLVQETFMVAYQQFAQLKNREKLGPWLRRVARNLALKKLRHRREILMDDVLLNSLEVAVQTSSNQQLLASLMACMQELPESSRHLLQWRYEHGKSCQEIATEFGRSLSWVKTNLHRLRKILSNCSERKLKEYAYGSQDPGADDF